jgi:methylase of polypeptide subunit release factors
MYSGSGWLMWVVRSTFGTNHFAKLDGIKLSDALDVGCGSGVWVLEMCHDYPDCTFTGMDILEAQPHTIAPKNARFIQANLMHRRF